MNINKKLKKIDHVQINGLQNLSLEQIISVARKWTPVSIELSPEANSRQKSVIDSLNSQIKAGVPIYGVSASYGAQAGHHVNQGEDETRWQKSKLLSDSIVHVDVSTGDALPIDVTRAAMLIRVNMLAPGYSAIRTSSLQLIVDLLNHKITPVVGRYGTLGASGDLAQNGRVLSVIRQLNNVEVIDSKGNKKPASEALSQIGLKPLDLMPKEGLALVNGDNFSTGATALITYDISRLFQLNLETAALSIQALKGSDRDFHPLISHVRPHPGQIYVADKLRELLQGSQLANQELKGHKPRQNGDSVQDPYSIRCMPQYYGPDLERLDQIFKTIEINANSVSDNPLWTTPETATEGEDPYQWVSGGNFLAMHMSEALDSLRKFGIHIVKQNDRHLNRLVNPKLNNGLSANLSDPEAISQCTFKGLQTQMGMYEVYASVLASPVNTAFGIHEELNQDLTSHALTSAIMTWKVIDLVKLSMATNLIASCQAIDLRGGPDLLSPSTKSLYSFVRTHVPYIKQEQPLGHLVELLSTKLMDYLDEA